MADWPARPDLVPIPSGFGSLTFPVPARFKALTYRLIDSRVVSERMIFMTMRKKPCVYMLRCCDDTLYTGWTNDIAHRLSVHNKGTGAKYTRGRRPVTLVYLEVLPDKSSALKREAAIKKMTRPQKEALIQASPLKTR